MNLRQEFRRLLIGLVAIWIGTLLVGVCILGALYGVSLWLERVVVPVVNGTVWLLERFFL